LIEQLFLEGRTEAEVARHQRITQQAVSKRKQAIVKELRVWLDPPNENQKIA
jgi:DNA-directed RNA polymerase specialized sigma subunit